MVTDEMMKRAIEAYAKDTGAEGFQLEGWIEPAIRAALEAALSAAEPQPAPSVAVKAIEAVWKYSLVIESSVRRGDGPDQYAGVTEALRLVKEARSALSAQVQDVAGSGGMEFPEALTDDLRDVLSTMIWTSGQIAACLRAGGDQIKTRAEDEQAHVLHWLISLALKHGPEWRAKASERIKAIRDAAAPAKQEG